MSTSTNALAAMSKGEQLVGQLLQHELIEVLAQLAPVERSAAIAGVLCRITSISLVLIGTQETQRLLALGVAAAPFAPIQAVEEAASVRAVIDALATRGGPLND